jgi:hypothetical protein
VIVCHPVGYFSPVVAAAPKSSEKPTPYEVWREKNKDKFIPKKQVREWIPYPALC